jgi:hypothetical protein
VAEGLVASGMRCRPEIICTHDILARVEPDRELYLAVSDTVYGDVFESAIGELLLANERLKLLVFNPETEVIQRWTPEPPTVK